MENTLTFKPKDARTVGAYNALTPAEQAALQKGSPEMFNSNVSTAAPVTPTVPVSRTPGLLDTATAAAATAASSRASAQQQADLYASQMRQARIDAINQSFAPRIQREEVAGQSRLSRVAALNLRSGIVGSGVDTTKTGEQTTLNEKSMQALEAEKAQAINEAFGWADQLSKQRAEDLYKSSTEGANANVAMYKEQADKAMKALDVFASGGYTAKDLQSVDPNTYATLRDVSGMSDTQIDAYLKAKTPAGTYQWNQAQINGSTMYVPKIVNGKISLDTVNLGFTPKKEVQNVEKIGDNVFILYKDGTHETLVNPGGSTSGGWGALSNNDKTDAENWLRQQKDFTQADLDKLHNDRTFQALVLKQVQTEKQAVLNPFQ